MNSPFAVETAKIVGTPADGCWSQIHTFIPEDVEKKKKRGELFAVLVISGVSEGIGAVTVGREILGRFHEEYYGNLQGSAFERLGLAVKKVCEENEELELVAACLVDHVLNIAICGNGKVLLKREEKIGLVLGGKGDFQTASGILKENDLVLIGSGRFFKVVAEGILRAALEAGSPTEAVEVIAPIILGREDMADAVAVLVLAKTKEVAPGIPVVTTVEEMPADEKKEKSVANAPKDEKSINFLGKFIGFLKFSPANLVFVRKQNFSKRKNLFPVFFLSFVLLAAGLVFGLRGKFMFIKNVNDQKIIRPVAEKVEQSSESLPVEPSLFMDLGLEVKGAEGNCWVFSGKNFAVLDGKQKKVYLVNPDKKVSGTRNLGQEAKFITSYGEKLFVLSSKGILELDSKEGMVNLKIRNNTFQENIIGMSSFNGNLYLLDNKENTVWRYTEFGGSFGEKKNWLADKSDLSQSLSLAIDGSVWILQKDRIEKFTLGKQENFSLKVSGLFSDPVKIFTTKEEQNLYVLDKGNGKIFVFSKNGELKNTYVWEGIKQANDILTNEASKKIFLLSGAKIYEIGMK